VVCVPNAAFHCRYGNSVARSGCRSAPTELILVTFRLFLYQIYIMYTCKTAQSNNEGSKFVRNDQEDVKYYADWSCAFVNGFTS
jgi:hypothetical protein